MKASRDCVAKLIEDTGADAVVLLFTTVRRGETQVCTYTYGNSLACQKLIETAYDESVDEPDEIEEA